MNAGPTPAARDTEGAYTVHPRAGVSLLDVNVLIALCDGRHEHHPIAAEWFVAHAGAGWASCPITQNGAIRILSTPAYPGARPVSQVLEQVRSLCAGAHHHFWPDAVSLVQPDVLDPHHVLGHRQLTDAYLLALAVRQGGRFVTLDGAVALQSVHGAKPTHLVRLL